MKKEKYNSYEEIGEKSLRFYNENINLQSMLSHMKSFRNIDMEGWKIRSSAIDVRMQQQSIKTESNISILIKIKFSIFYIIY